MTNRPFPYAEFREHMVELGYKLDPMKPRVAGEWWDPRMYGKYGDVPVEIRITRLDEKCMYVAEIEAGERRKSVGLITLNRHFHGWKMGYISGWGSWLQGKEFTTKEKPLAYTYWGQE
jgi:hypothetical protein